MIQTILVRLLLPRSVQVWLIINQFGDTVEGLDTKDKKDRKKNQRKERGGVDKSRWKAPDSLARSQLHGMLLLESGEGVTLY